MLWRIDTALVLPDQQLHQKLMLHLRYARISTLLVQIQSRQQCYIMTEGCLDCRHDRCQPGCRTQLLRRILQSYGLSMQPVPQGLAARPYTQLLLALPTPQAQLLAAPDLADCSESRLQLTWSMQGQQLRLALLLAFVGTPDTALNMLRSKGWWALPLPRLFVQHYAARAHPGHIFLTGRLSRLMPMITLSILPTLSQGELLDRDLVALGDGTPSSPGFLPYTDKDPLPHCEALPTPCSPLSCTAEAGLEVRALPDVSSAYERLLALGQRVEAHSTHSAALHLSAETPTTTPVSACLAVPESPNVSVAHPADARSLTHDPGNILPIPIQQLEQWVNILTSEATLHEGRPGRAGLAASRLAWALGIPMRTARMLMVWLDDANLLDSPSNPLQIWSGPRPLITRDAVELLKCLQETAAPAEDRVQMAYAKSQSLAVKSQESMRVESNV